MSFNSLRIDIQNIDPSFEVFGPLRSEGESETTIPYLPYQISKYGIGIIAKAGMDVLRDLVLQTTAGPIKLRVLSVETNGAPENGARYNLMAVGFDIDLEQIFNNDPKIRQMVGDALLHFARFQTNPPAIMQAKTFGSTNPYMFKSINASKTGAFVVSHNNKGRIPFSDSTLIEWQFQPNDSWLLRKVAGVGRIAHQTTHEGKGGLKIQYYGIELKDFRGDGELVWRQALENLERQTIERQLKEANRPAS